MKYKRIFLIVLDGVGVGDAPDCLSFNDQNNNTLKHIDDNFPLFIPNLKKIGFMNTTNLTELKDVEAYYTIAKPKNPGKDSLNGHYEMVGVKSDTSFAIFNDGFPREILQSIVNVSGRKILGNKASINGNILEELGAVAKNYGALIIFTTGGSDLHIAAHEDIVPIASLYTYCEKLRDLSDKFNWKIARIIARPFTGKEKYRFISSARKDYSKEPPSPGVLEAIRNKGYDVIGIGKVNDIFVGSNRINKNIKASDNNESINKLLNIMEKEWSGLCFVNLPDFDNYGHLKDTENFAKAIEEFDVNIPIIQNKLELDDLLIITADHGNDPTAATNAHTRENLPVIIYGRNLREPKLLDSFNSLSVIGATIADNFEVNDNSFGESILDKLI